MSQRSSSSDLLQSSLVLVAGVAIGAAAASSLYWFRFQKATTSNRNDDNNDPTTTTKQTTKSSNSFPLELRQEQLSRHTLFFGDKGMERLKGARVCVVGAGGVGSHTACSLMRAGVGYLRVIDFDQVSLSSLNRHACATLQDVGTSKVAVLERYARNLCPDSKYLQVEGLAEMYTAETGERLLSLDSAGHTRVNGNNSNNETQPQWDWIIDAIDDVPTKAELVYHAWREGIPILSCMGAAGKADFTRLHVSDLKSASRDPLATKLRQYLKRKVPKEELQNLLQDADRLAILFSSEKVVAKLADFTEEQLENPGEFGAVQGMRIRVLPVLGTMPAIMGQALAAWVLTAVAQLPFHPVTGERVSKNVRNKLWNKLNHKEEVFRHEILQECNITDPAQVERFRMQGGLVQRNSNGSSPGNNVWIGPIQIDSDDVEYLLEIWRNRCSVTGARLGTVLELVRYDMSKPSTCNNLVLLSTHARADWEKHGKSPNHLPQDVRATIEARLSTCRVDSQG